MKLSSGHKIGPIEGLRAWIVFKLGFHVVVVVALLALCCSLTVKFLVVVVAVKSES